LVKKFSHECQKETTNEVKGIVKRKGKRGNKKRVIE
jgi:hypothetical protein